MPEATKPITIKSIAIARKDQLIKKQDFAGAALIRDFHNILDPMGSREINEEQAAAVNTFIDILLLNQHKALYPKRDLSLLITHSQCSIQRMADKLQSEPAIGRKFKSAITYEERARLAAVQFKILERDLPDLTESEKQELQIQLGVVK